MNINNNRTNDLIMVAIVAAVAIIRVCNNASPNLETLANFSPVGAMALFGAAAFRQTAKAILLPLAVLFCSDVVLYATVYKTHASGILYGGWYWVYGAFALMAIAARAILRRVIVASVAVAALVSVFIHWIVTDFGVWLGSTTYPQNLAGFMACLVAAIPFELRFLSATLLYSALMFGLQQVLLRRFAAARA